MKSQTHSLAPRGFTLIETLLMLFALALFSLTTLAVLKRDQFSIAIILSKFRDPAASKPPTPVKAASLSAKAEPLPSKTKEPASPKSLPVPVSEGAKAGSPASPAKP